MGNLLFKLFIKNREDISDPAVREQYGKLAGIVGIVSNLILCIMKISIGLFSKSIAIVADGINNLADASSSIITLIGFKLASAPEDEEHPYGHARIEYLTGLFISILIIIVGVQLLKTSVNKIIHPDPLIFSYVTIFILTAAIFIKLWQSIFNVTVGKKIKSVALMATAADSRNDVISTVAVLISIFISKVTGINIDGYVGCLVALFIIWSGIQLVRETSSTLLGEVADREMVEEILEIVLKEPRVLGVHDLMVHNYGPGKIFASAHVEVDADADLMKSHDMIDNIERTVKELLRIHFVIHMDPIRINDPLIDKMRGVIASAFRTIEGLDNIHDFRIVPGPTHTNIIFDAVLEPSCSMTEKEITKIADDAVKAVDKTYFVVITFDKAYTRL